MKHSVRDEYLAQLVQQGYGDTKLDVMNYLLDREFDDLLRCGVLKSKRTKSKDEVSK